MQHWEFLGKKMQMLKNSSLLDGEKVEPWLSLMAYKPGILSSFYQKYSKEDSRKKDIL